MKINLWTGEITDEIKFGQPTPVVQPVEAIPIRPPVPIVEAQAPPLEIRPEDVKELIDEARKVLSGGREAYGRFIEAVRKLREQRRERAEAKKIEAMGIKPTEIPEKPKEFVEAIEREKKLKEVM